MQPAETASQHSICISKPPFKFLRHLRARADARVRRRVCPSSHLHTPAFFFCLFCFFFPALSELARLLAEVASVPPQLHLIPDKSAHCFLGNNNFQKAKKRRKLDSSALKHSEKTPIPLGAAVGAQALIPSVILSLCLEGAVSQRRASLSVWTERTSRADVTIMADIDSSGWGPSPPRCST